MIGLFTDSMIQTRRYSFPRMNAIRKHSAEQLDKLNEYITARQLYLPNTHVIIRLLKSINVSMKTDIYEYVYGVEDSVRTITHGLDFTSSTNQGKVHRPGQFINPHVGEIIISNTESFDVDIAIRDWQKLTPLKFLDHPCSDLSYGLPNGNYTLDSEDGLAVISINVPMLALQYRCWLTECMKQKLEMLPPIASFVMAYPLMNMAKSHADIAIFNRLYNDVLQYKNTDFVRRNPIALVDYTSAIDGVLAEYKTILERTPLDFQTIIDNIPTLYYGNFHNAVRLPKMASTRQLRWALLVARLKMFHFLIVIDQKHNLYNNRSSITDIKQIIQDMENDNAISKSIGSTETNRIIQIKDLIY